MITVSFFEDNKGVRISGHSGYSEEGSDIICASVSSAAYLTANTLTEIVGADADIDISDGFMELVLTETTKETDILMNGLRLHINQLSQQYPHHVIVKE